MAEMPPQLSVVVCTHNRPDDLERCLDALARLDDKPQVIVVDSATEPPCEALVARYETALPGLVYEYESEPGLSRARNRGVARASGSIVAFLDDDAAPHRDWSRAILAPFAADARIGCVGGACAAAFEPEAERPQWLSDRLLQFAGITRFGDVARAGTVEHRMAVRREHGVPRLGTRVRPVRRRARPKRHDAPPGEESALVERLARGRVDGLAGATGSRRPHRHARALQLELLLAPLWWAGVTRARRADCPSTGFRLVARRADPRPALPPHARSRLPLSVGGDRRVSRRAAAPLAERRMRRITPSASLLRRWRCSPWHSLVRLDQHHSALLYPDGYQYLLMARGIGEHLQPTTVLGPGGDAFVPNPDAAVKPLFPLVVAAVHAVGISWLDAATLVTVVAGAWAVTAVALLVRGLSGSTAAGLAAGTLVLASPSVAFWTGFSGPDPLAVALVFSSALAFVDRRARLGGVLAGLAVAARPEMVLLALAAGVLALRDDAAAWSSAAPRPPRSSRPRSCSRCSAHPRRSTIGDSPSSCPSPWAPSCS